MNRPEKRNAMSPTLAAEMLEVIEALEVDDRCEVLVLTGAGESCSGRHGPEGISSATPTRCRRPSASRSSAPMRNGSGASCSSIRKPTIAMVNGWCFGGAFTPLVVLRPRDRGRGGDVRPLGDQLGHHPGRRRDQGGGAGDEPARRALLHHDRRDLRRPQGRRHEARQRGGAAASSCASARGRWPRP